MDDLVVRAAEMPRDLPIVQKLCWEYRDYLINFNDEVRDTVETFYPQKTYAALLDDLPVKHARPRGAILLIEHGGNPVGCGMTQPLSDTDAEVKRVFIRHQARGLGAGRHLSQALITQARNDGFKRLLLDTSVFFAGAQALYEKLGFRKRGPYSVLPPDSEQGLVFYELTL